MAASAPPTVHDGEGLRITLSGLAGLTVDQNGQKLLTAPFVLQCGPMEEFAITRQFTMGNYDTVTGTQYARRGSNQLRVWSFDSLAMRMGRKEGVPASDPNSLEPSWVPFPALNQGVPVGPDWYAGQLATLLYSGAPFKFTAAYTGYPAPIMHCYAVLLQYNEGYKAGEDDAIYFEQLSFSEWRDPTIKQIGLAKATGTKKGATYVNVATTGPNAGIAFDDKDKRIPKTGVTTLASLAKYFWGEPADWRQIARANSLTDGSANTPLLNFSRFKNLRGKSIRLKIPARNKPAQKTNSNSGTTGGVSA